jgi:hypothetical protein
MRELLPRAAVFGFLIDWCFTLRKNTAADIERHWQLPPEEAYALGIRSCPTEIQNIIASSACAERFGDDLLNDIPGFYKFDRQGSQCNCLEWRDDCLCHLQLWRMDLDPRLSFRGFILPVRDPQFLFFDALRVFRNAQDSTGFIYRLRTERAAAA